MAQKKRKHERSSIKHRGQVQKSPKKHSRQIANPNSKKRQHFGTDPFKNLPPGISKTVDFSSSKQRHPKLLEEFRNHENSSKNRSPQTFLWRKHEKQNLQIKNEGNVRLQAINKHRKSANFDRINMNKNMNINKTQADRQTEFSKRKFSSKRLRASVENPEQEEEPERLSLEREEIDIHIRNMGKGESLEERFRALGREGGMGTGQAIKTDIVPKFGGNINARGQNGGCFTGFENEHSFGDNINGREIDHDNGNTDMPWEADNQNCNERNMQKRGRYRGQKSKNQHFHEINEQDLETAQNSRKMDRQSDPNLKTSDQANEYLKSQNNPTNRRTANNSANNSSSGFENFQLQIREQFGFKTRAKMQKAQSIRNRKLEEIKHRQSNLGNFQTQNPWD